MKGTDEHYKSQIERNGYKVSKSIFGYVAKKRFENGKIRVKSSTVYGLYHTVFNYRFISKIINK